jgi:hypothetical protein
MDNLKELDQWELALEEQIKILQKCQQSYNFTSCSQCNQIIECTTRQQYIKSVYASMNKDSKGGFEF